MRLKHFLSVFLTLLTLSVGQMWGASYTITFSTGSNDGSKVSTSTACSDIVSDGSSYLSGNLVTATNAYSAGSAGLKLGKSSNSPAGDLKMNLSTAGQLVPTKVSVYAKYYSSSAKGTVQMCTNLGSNTATTTTGSFTAYDYSYAGSTALSYLEVKSNKYIWVQKIVVSYKGTVTFDANGGSCTTTSLTQSSATASITLPTPTRYGFTCTGWYTAESGGTKRGNAGATYTPDVSETLYAQWEAATPSCTVKPTVGTNLTSVSATANSITATIPISSIGGCNIIENGLVYSSSVATPTIGAANCTKVTTTACGSTAANKTVTITGLTCGQSYYVRGYAENEAGIQYTDVLTQSTSDCPKYTVTYNAGTGSCETQYWTQTEANESTTLPTASTNCKGWTFAGWCTSAAGSSETNTTSPGDILTGSYKPTSNITLYAVYTKSEGSPESWNQITDASNVTGGTYVIVASTSTLTGYLPNTETASAPTYVTTGLTISNGKITSTVTDEMKWTFSTGTWDDTEEYMYDITITNQDETPKVLNNYANANNGVRVDANSGTWTIGNHESGTSDVLYLWSNGRYCGVYNNADWRSYTTYNANNYTADAGSSMIKLFKRTGGSVTYYMSSLDCCTELASINGSFF